MKDKTLIPQGRYCHGPITTHIDENGKKTYHKPYMCPYWSLDERGEEQMNGYCDFLEKGDGDDSIYLLWDQCKECNVNMEEPKDELVSIG